MNKIELVINALSNLNDRVLVRAFSDFCDERRNYADSLWLTAEIDYDWDGVSLTKAINDFRNFDMSCPAYRHSSQGIVEVWRVWEDWVRNFADDFADFVIENGNDYGNTALRSALAVVESA